MLLWRTFVTFIVRMFTQLFRIALAISLVAVVAGCGEKVPLKAKKSTYEISYTGNLLMASPIQFQSSTPAGKSTLWIFSDGETSTEFAPVHKFYKVSHNGTEIIEDTATLIVDNDIYHPNQKTFLLKPAVPVIAATYTWKGGKFTMHGNCCPGLTDHLLNDTTFQVAIQDEYTLKTWGVKLPYLADSNYYSNERTATKYNATWVIYTPDTLFFRQASGDANGWAEVSYYHKY